MQLLLDNLNAIVWSNALLVLALGAGVLFSILTRFAQIRHIREMLRLLVSGGESARGVSPFQAFTVALSNRVGMGNIAGVASAIAFGGPGAIFWMWVVAFLGAATAYIESTLAQVYKEELDGEYRGGPAFYIEKAMGQKWYAMIIAVALISALGVAGQTVQANGISNAMEVAFGSGGTISTVFGEVGVTKASAGIVVAVLVGFVIFGGVKRIAHFSQVVVPFMALAYITTAIVICILNINLLPSVISMIFADAFTPMAGTGAVIGWGVRRGIYSSEAGEGTGTHAAAAAEVQHPAQQGLVQAFSVYVDTLFVCSATAFVILTTGAYNVYGGEAQLLINNLPGTVDPNGPAYTQHALDSVIPGMGSKFVAMAVFFFATTTLLASYYCAETNIAYLMRSIRIPKAFLMFKILTIAVILYGATNPPTIAWGLSDLAVGVNTWMNLIALLIILVIMGNPAIKALRDYEAQQKAGVETFTFDPKALGIRNASFWEKDSA